MNAYIVDAVRTPVGRFGGLFSRTRADDLAAMPVKALLERHPQLDWTCIDDTVLGCANQAGEDNRNVARMAVLLAGLTDRIPGTTLNRLCGSGLDAVSTVARGIKAGELGLALAGGVESMTRAPFVMGKSEKPFSRNSQLEDTTIGWRFINPSLRERYGVDSMPETADNVAFEYRISREDQDKFALRSQSNYARALSRDFFKEEIVPVTIPVGRDETRIINQDEHPRPSTTLEVLSKLKPINGPDCTVTPGNASGINDGACALLIASDEALVKHRLVPRARIVGTAVAGVPPRIMGIGPLPAVKKVLAMTGLSLTDMDTIELNEAFAAQGLAVMRELGLSDDDPRINPNGGAIAIGHPLGMSGARLVTTALNQLEVTGGRYGLCTMCIGVGQGIAMIIERIPQP
ncbi:3-oxoadipyl-CoA thiolase [Marinobacter oulmenensis]|uniref:3-oxoadipyl-CoA thiolase n=1 Tax=Marinobacter oulmenensis TaxID=643747 RepID=A0A840UBX6_9GAMM|nr:3-oxoadipyl-CoA thiolase [Marinobacter oulmenensis]MBB5321703.1 3-oxoadipyl-CoA thiolase [Marinobacter oulmenensis]